MSEAGYIPQEKVDEVRLAADVVDVVGKRIRLTQKGKDFWGLCPFHGDKDPSLKVDRSRGTWYCFGCSEGGSVFNFVMKDEGLSFPEAVKELARRYGVELPKPKLSPQQERERAKRQALLQVLELAGKFFNQQLMGPEGRAARKYLMENRGLSPEVIKDFGLGYAPDSWEALGRHLRSKRVPEEMAVEAGLAIKRDRGRGCYDRFRGRAMFSIRSWGGRLISFGGRIMGQGEPKYMNGPETPVFNKSRNLYNLDRARPQMRKKDRAILVEGYFDVITLAAGGFGETAAPLGTALTEHQVRRLKGQAAEAVLVFDGDQAGVRAALRSLPVFLEAGLPARVCLLPAGEDPDSFLRKQGPEAFEQALGQARPLVETALDRLVEQGDASTPEGKSAIVGEAGSILKAVKDPVSSWLYLERLSRKLGVPPEVTARRLGLPLPGRGRTPEISAPPKQDDILAAEQKGILQLALSSSQAARDLVQGGALAWITDPRLAAVCRALQDVLDRGAELSAAAVCQSLEDQSLAGLVEELCQQCLDLDKEQAVHAARQQLALLDKRRIKRQRAGRIKAIAKARADGDMEKVTRIQAQWMPAINHNPSPEPEKD